SALRFFVDGHVKRAAHDRKADWHDVRKCAPVRGGEMGNPLLDQESALGLRQHERPQGLTLPRNSEGCRERWIASSHWRAGSHLATPQAAREEPLVPGERFELPTNGLQNRCSTTELTRQGFETVEPFHPRREQNRLVATALLPFISWSGSVKRAA